MSVVPEEPRGEPSGAAWQELRDDDPTLRRKLFWMIVLRTLIVTTVFGAILMVQFISGETLPIAPLYYLLGAVYPLTLLYTYCYKRMGAVQVQAYAQILGDMLFLTGLVYYTGGLLSPFYFLYIIPIITASIALYRKGSLVVAAVSGILYGGLVDLMYYGAVPFFGEKRNLAEDISVGVIYYNIFSSFFGFFAAALLSSYLSENLKRTGAQLQVKMGDLAELQHIHQDIVDNMASGLLSTDLHGQIITINPAGCKIIGCEPADVQGHELGDVLGAGPDFFDHLYHELTETRVVRFEKEATFPGDRMLVIGVSVSLLHTRTGTPTGFVFNFQDLTEIRRLEQEVRIKDRLAAVGEMAAGIAHEIRNPLASISGSVQVLREELHLTSEQQYLMDIVMRESARLDQTLEAFLDYARPHRLAMEEIDLAAIAKETVTLLSNSYELSPEHKVDLRVDSAAPFTGDRHQWSQVFWNLSKNAIKAMPFGGRLTIEIDRGTGGGYRLVFRDTGIGMTDDEAQRAGQPFFSAFDRGTGLGMAIVQRIVQDYDGRLRIHSQKGVGTDIEILLPPQIALGAAQHASGGAQA